MSDFYRFIMAIMENDSENVRRLFEKGFITEIWDGRTALHWASQYNNDGRIVQFLISNCCDIEAESIEAGVLSGRGGARPIHVAARCGNQAAIKALFEGTCSLDCVNTSGETPLDVAIRVREKECERILRLLMKERKGKVKEEGSRKRPDNKKEKDAYLKLMKKNNLSKIVDIETGKTLLDKLLSYHDQEVLDAIKSKPVEEKEIKDWISLKLRRTDSRSYRLLHECLLLRSIHHKYDSGVYALCNADIVNSESLFFGPSPLETAVEFGTVFWVKTILEKLVRVDSSWTRAKDIAAKNNLTHIESLITKRRSYVTRKKESGYSRLHTAVIDNDPDLVEYILRNNIVNPDEIHKTFGTALSLAYIMNHMECVQSLQNNNVSVNTIDMLRQSPLHVAISNKIEDHGDYLINNTINLELTDYMGLTVLDRAVLNNCRDLCERLVKKGSNCDRYVNILSRHLELGLDVTVVLPKPPLLPITNQETIFSLCFKVNRILYPCLMDQIVQCNVDLPDGDNNTLLYLSAVSLMPRLCSQLIQKKANVNFINKNQNTILLGVLKENLGREMNEETEHDLIKTVDILIEGGAYLDVDVLEISTKYKREKLLLSLLRRREPLECIKPSLWMTWVDRRYLKLIKEVIALLKQSLLEELITVGFIKDILREDDMIMAKIMYDNASCCVRGSTVEVMLMQAASIGNKSLFDNLITDEISTNSELNNGQSLLSCLIQQKNNVLIEVVLNSKNATLFLERKDGEKKLPLHLCIENDSLDIIDRMIMNTTCINEEDNDGNTALSLLLCKISETCDEDALTRLMTFVELLIKQSADIYRVNRRGRNNLSYCIDPRKQSRIEAMFRAYQGGQQTAGPRTATEDVVATSPTKKDQVEQNETSSMLICVICADEPTNCVLNCGHAFCMTCAEKEVYCYMCRQKITKRMKLFL